MIRDWWIVIHFVCFVFKVRCLSCDRPVLGNNRLVKFASQIFLIFLILVTCKSKATSASFLWQKICSPSQFPSLFLNSVESFSAKLGEHVIVICINPAFTKMIDGTENPKSLWSLQYALCDTMNFAEFHGKVWVSLPISRTFLVLIFDPKDTSLGPHTFDEVNLDSFLSSQPQVFSSC